MQGLNSMVRQQENIFKCQMNWPQKTEEDEI